MIVPSAPCAYAMNNIGALGILHIEQIALTDQRVLDLARQFEPFLARASPKIAERADRLLPRSFRRMDRFHQHVVDVALTLVGPNRFADVHIPLYDKYHPLANGLITNF